MEIYTYFLYTYPSMENIHLSSSTNPSIAPSPSMDLSSAKKTNEIDPSTKRNR
jgi:hypothetical protein